MSMPATTTSTAQHQGYSPQALAWLRLKKNVPAMLSLFFLLLLLFTCFILPALLPMDPFAQRPWVGTRGLMYQHPYCLNTNLFLLGEAAEFTTPADASGRLKLSVRQETCSDYRISVRRGLLQIKKKIGGENMAQLDLSNPTIQAYENLVQLGQYGRLMPCVLLKSGEALPESWKPYFERQMWLRVFTQPTRMLNYDIQLAHGRVEKIGFAGRSLTQLTVQGSDISSMTFNDHAWSELHVLGTDALGRDLLCRIIYGGRVSLLVGMVATLVSLVIGVIYGVLSGYRGGLTDRVMMSGVDVLYAIPFMFLVILLMVSFGRNLLLLFVALGAVQWLTMSRIVRAQVLSLKMSTFVDAARLSGTGPAGIMVRHLLPNIASSIIVYTTLTVPAVILEESFLSFIGLTIQYNGESLDSWGTLVHQGMLSMGDHGERSWLLVCPSLAMMLTLLALNSLGDGLRDAFDPRISSV